MTPTFLLAVDVGSDTDLLGIAQEIQDAVEEKFPVLSCKPWAQGTAGGAFSSPAPLQQLPPTQLP